jgi:uncharacterized protein (DUF934 family)
LREQYGFRGELRATGEVLRDQLAFMVRSGFDSFAVKKEADAERFADAVGRYTAFYQPAADGPVMARQQRLGRQIENSPCRSPPTGHVSGASTGASD